MYMMVKALAPVWRRRAVFTSWTAEFAGKSKACDTSTVASIATEPKPRGTADTVATHAARATNTWETPILAMWSPVAAQLPCLTARWGAHTAVSDCSVAVLEYVAPALQLYLQRVHTCTELYCCGVADSTVLLVTRKSRKLEVLAFDK